MSGRQSGSAPDRGAGESRPGKWRPGERSGRASYPRRDRAGPEPVELQLELLLEAPAAPEHPVDLRAAAQARLEALWAHARPHLGRRRWDMPTLAFYRRRTDAGRAVLQAQRIEVNEDLLERHPEPMLEETIAHELAHLLVYRLFGRRARSHGAEWQTLMRDWFGVAPQRTHDFDLRGLRVRRQQRYAYHCGCRQHELSSVRHRRAVRGVDYRCVACQGRLRYLQTGASTSPDD